LGNLFQCVTTLCVKKFLLISNLNLPCLCLKPFPLVLSLSTDINSHFPSSLYAPFKYWKATVRSPQSLLQAKQSQFPQPFLIEEVLQPSDHLSGPLLDPLQELHVLPVLGAPGLDAVLQMEPYKRGTITSLSLLATLFLMQPRTQLAVWAAKAHSRVVRVRVVSWMHTRQLSSLREGRAMWWW